MADDTIGTGQDFATVVLWHADIGVDVDVGSPRIGLLSVDEELAHATLNVSNANNAPHTLGADTAVRHDGSGAPNGARMQAAVTRHGIILGTNHFIIQDLLILGAGGRRVIYPQTTADNCIIRRCALVNNTNNANSTCVLGDASSSNLEWYLNNMFVIGTSRQVANLANQLGGKVYCNTFTVDDGFASLFGLAAVDGDNIDVRGNLVVGKTAMTVEFNGVGAAGSTQNAGEDGSAATMGSADYDFTDDLGLTPDDMCENLVAGGTLNMLRKAANHGDMPITDVSATTGTVDVTGATFDGGAMVVGAHQLAVVAGAIGENKRMNLGPGLGLGGR